MSLWPNDAKALYSPFFVTALCLLLFLFSTSDHRAPTAGGVEQELAMSTAAAQLDRRVIVIDPGHGGRDPGAVGIGPTTEADNVLAIAWHLKEALEERGAAVLLTRRTNVCPAERTALASLPHGPLTARTQLANRSRADLFVSLHNNSAPENTTAGTATYFYSANDRLLAEYIQQNLTSHLRSPDRGVHRANLYVLRNTTMPAALVEVGFVSNAREAALLAQPWYRKQAAQGIAAGISAYVDHLEKAGIQP